MELITIPGCTRAKILKYMFRDANVPYREESLLKLFTDADKNRGLIEALAATYQIRPDELLNAPSLVSRPLLIVPDHPDPKQQALLEQIGKSEIYPHCQKKCAKRSVCPAAKAPIVMLAESAIRKTGKNPQNLEQFS